MRVAHQHALRDVKGVLRRSFGTARSSGTQTVLQLMDKRLEFASRVGALVGFEKIGEDDQASAEQIEFSHVTKCLHQASGAERSILYQERSIETPQRALS